jgi:DNA ligase-1
MFRSQYPDVVSLIKCIFARASNLQSFIVDSEIVAIDPDSGSLRSFQELSNRARKDVEIRDIKIPVCVFAFDLMYLDGEASFISSSPS